MVRGARECGYPEGEIAPIVNVVRGTNNLLASREMNAPRVEHKD